MGRRTAAVRRWLTSSTIVAGAIGALAAMGGGVASAAPPEVDYASYVFDARGLWLDDLNGDGAKDIVGRQGDDFGEMRIWYARPEGPSRFRLRPDVVLRPPAGALLAFQIHQGGRDGAAGTGDRVPSFVAIDNDGLLAATPPGDWERVLELPIAAPGDFAPRPPGIGLEASGAGALDLDGDGEVELPIVDRDGWWRVAWGPLARPGVAVSAPLAPAFAARTTTINTMPRAPFLVGAYRGLQPVQTAGSIVRTGAPAGRGATGPATRPITSVDRGAPAEGPDRSAWRGGIDRITMVAAVNGRPGGVEIGGQAWRATERGRLVELPAGERLQRAAGQPPDPADAADPAAGDAAAAAPPRSFDDALWDWLEEVKASAGDDARVSWQRADLNGDGIQDVLLAMGSADPLRPRTVLRAYLGSGDPDRLPDRDAPHAVLRTRSPFAGGGPVVRDVDGDGDLDTWLFEIDAELASPSDQLKAYLQVGVRGRLRVFCWDDADGYVADRSFALPMTVKYEVHGNRLPYLREIGPRADFNGDGTLDVVLRTGARSIELWGFEAGRGFGGRPIATIETAAPVSIVFTDDYDGDPFADLRLNLENGATQLVFPRRR